MKVREYTLADAKMVAALFADTIRSVNAKHYSEKQLSVWASPDKDANFFHNKLSKTHSFVAEDGAEVVGFADFMPERKLLDFFYVHKEHMRKGVGKALLTHIEATAKENGVAEIYTHASITAKPFFEAMGFIPLEKREVEVQGIRLTNYTMRKSLSHEE